ncbi:MAG: hypothetical protein PF569_03415 [Candidatus Woesearchaeota archaeon]|jgi:hypothetical protein|nr:hypothetical protein [Candidatus Woesearchaeota archaeon]
MVETESELLSLIYSNLKELLDQIEDKKIFVELMRKNSNLESRLHTTNFKLKISINGIKDEDLSELTYKMNTYKNNLSSAHSNFLGKSDENYNKIKNIAILQLKDLFICAYDLGIHL